MAIIEVKNLKFSYSKSNYAINDLSLEIKQGDFICILGHNGSGKSTLAKLVTGLLKANEGEIYINGTLLTEETVDSLRKKIGIVFKILIINLLALLFVMILLWIRKPSIPKG